MRSDSAFAEGQAPEPPKLSLSLVGSISGEIGGKRIDLRSRKMAALLGYLALSDSAFETRERLVGLFWSESDEDKARGSLRQTLRGLRHVFHTAGFSGFFADKQNIALDRDQALSDVRQIVDTAERRGVHPLLLNVPRLSERLFDGFEDVDPMFRIWLLARRQTLHDRLSRHLEELLADDCAGAMDKDRAAEALVNLDPTHELACRHLMRSRAERGDIGGALRIYKALWERLDDEYAMEPSDETMQLVTEIKTGAIEHAAAVAQPAAQSPQMAQPAATPSRHLVLGVAQFDIADVDGDQRNLVHGFRHALIACLVRFREWQVVDVVGAPDDHDAFAPKFVIAASVHQHGNQLHVMLTLQDRSVRRFIWSDTFELRDGEWQALQQRVVGRVTAALNVYISVDRLNRVSTIQSVTPQLYDLWLRGQAMILRFRPDDWQRANSLLRSVIASAPEFAPVYSSLAQLGNTEHIVHPGLFRSPARQLETLSLALTATQLDPIDSRAHLCLAWAHAYVEQYDQALLHFDLACDLNDHDPWTLLSAAQGHAFLASPARAAALSEQASRLTMQPAASHWGYYAGVCFMRADYEGALAAAQQAGDALISNGSWRAAALYGMGRHDDAAREARQCLDLVRSRWLGPDPATDDRINAWLLQLFPIQHQADRERLRRGLACASAPQS